MHYGVHARDHLVRAEVLRQAGDSASLLYAVPSATVFIFCLTLMTPESKALEAGVVVNFEVPQGR
jgi:hypothetical protein